MDPFRLNNTLRQAARDKKGFLAFLSTLPPETTFDPTDPCGCPVHDFLVSLLPNSELSVTPDSVSIFEGDNQGGFLLLGGTYLKRVQLAFFNAESHRRGNRVPLAEVIEAAKETAKR
jgi:hypothetical protein